MSSAPVRVAVFASGRGSNFDAILAAIRAGSLNAEVVALLSDQANAPALEKARQAGIRAISVPWIKGGGDAGRVAHEAKVLEELKPLAPQFLVLAGYMRIMTDRLIEAFRSERGYSRIVNVHPSLLPSFPGVSAYEQAYLHGVHTTGVTVHLVEREVDSGPICAQEAFSISACRSVAEVEKLGLQIEHRLFPNTLAWVLPEKFDVESTRRLRVRPH